MLNLDPNNIDIAYFDPKLKMRCIFYGYESNHNTVTWLYTYTQKCTYIYTVTYIDSFFIMYQLVSSASNSIPYSLYLENSTLPLRQLRWQSSLLWRLQRLQDIELVKKINKNTSLGIVIYPYTYYCPPSQCQVFDDRRI